MISIDIIYSGYNEAPNGASRFVKLLASLKNSFLKEEQQIRVISQDNVVSEKRGEQKLFFDYNRHAKIRNIAKKSRILTAVLIYKNAIVPAKKICKYYNSTYGDNGGKIAAFQESFTCFYYLLCRKNHRQKVLLTMHNNGDMWSMIYEKYPLFKSRLFNSFRNKMTKTLLEGCDRIGFVADNARKRFCETYNYDPSKTFYVYNGIENRPLDVRKEINEEYVCFISVGTLDSRKNQLGVLESISLLPPVVQKKVKITFVGDGPARKEIEVFAKKLSCCVECIGNSNKVDDYLSNADCFILFSKDEGLPISIIEGMRASLPIIGTRIAGIPEQVVDGWNGYLVEVNNEQLAFAIERILEMDRGKMRGMGSNSFDLFQERFTIEAMVKGYVNLYKSVLL